MDINLNGRLLYIIPGISIDLLRLLKGGSMVQILLLCMMLFQSASPTATKPVIDNDRVSVRTSQTTPHQRSQLTLLLFLSPAMRYMCRKELPRRSAAARL